MSIRNPQRIRVDPRCRSDDRLRVRRGVVLPGVRIEMDVAVLLIYNRHTKIARVLARQAQMTGDDSFCVYSPSLRPTHER